MQPKAAKKKGSSVEMSNLTSQFPSQFTAEDYNSMPANEIVRCIFELNPDPAIKQLALALTERIPHDNALCAEEDRRSRSIVISRIPEADLSLPPMKRQRDLDQKVVDLLDVLKIECHPVQVFRTGKPDPMKTTVLNYPT
ncbi:hypothetical protein ANCDUO_04539 [Ancylostoma duodenale]|uniref:Uncharacterized protein n=1 Tax=Ancylostoma duodenale TaxID=51022 RepID=A0A0C2H6R7_9BILA|nr:hypothetical protein ANCDUO_04539 [Ancylostoma duodenale]